MAATAISMLPCPEMMTIGMPGCSRFTALRMSIPSMAESFSQMSRIIRLGASRSISAMHSSEVPASRVV